MLQLHTTMALAPTHSSGLSALAMSNPAEALSSNVKLTFLRSSRSALSLCRLSRTRTYTTVSSAGTPYGPGSDLCRFLTWLGEKMLDAYVDLIIRAKLAPYADLSTERARQALYDPLPCGELVKTLLCSPSAWFLVSAQRYNPTDSAG